MNNVLPMGLCCAPPAWQKFITLSLSDLKGCIAYMDDICVYGRSIEEHLHNLDKVLTRLNYLNLRLNLGKCVFSITEIEFLGLCDLNCRGETDFGEHQGNFGVPKTDQYYSEQARMNVKAVTFIL